MPLRLPNRTNVPPGGWSYQIPETGKLLNNYPNEWALIDACKTAYRGAGYPMPEDIRERIEAFICAGHPRYCGERAAEPKVAPKGLFHTFHAALQCLKTLIQNSRAASGEKPTQELANARAAVCAECPENQDVAGCLGCSLKSVEYLIMRIVGAAKTPSDARLKFCNVCHCGNKAKVWTKHAAIWNNMPMEQRKRLPATCWIIKEAPPS